MLRSQARYMDKESEQSGRSRWCADMYLSDYCQLLWAPGMNVHELSLHYTAAGVNPKASISYLWVMSMFWFKCMLKPHGTAGDCVSTSVTSGCTHAPKGTWAYPVNGI